MEGQHLHTGIVELTITAVYVIVAINVLRLAAAYMAQKDNELAQGAGKIIGSLVSSS